MLFPRVLTICLRSRHRLKWPTLLVAFLAGAGVFYLLTDKGTGQSLVGRKVVNQIKTVKEEVSRVDIVQVVKDKEELDKLQCGFKACPQTKEGELI